MDRTKDLERWESPLSPKYRFYGATTNITARTLNPQKKMPKKDKKRCHFFNDFRINISFGEMLEILGKRRGEVFFVQTVPPSIFWPHSYIARSPIKVVPRSKRRSTAVQNFCPIKNSLRSEEVMAIWKMFQTYFFKKNRIKKIRIFFLHWNP